MGNFLKSFLSISLIGSTMIYASFLSLNFVNAVKMYSFIFIVVPIAYFFVFRAFSFHIRPFRLKTLNRNLTVNMIAQICSRVNRSSTLNC